MTLRSARAFSTHLPRCSDYWTRNHLGCKAKIQTICQYISSVSCYFVSILPTWWWWWWWHDYLQPAVWLMRPTPVVTRSCWNVKFKEFDRSVLISSLSAFLMSSSIGNPHTNNCCSIYYIFYDRDENVVCFSAYLKHIDHTDYFLSSQTISCHCCSENYS